MNRPTSIPWGDHDIAYRCVFCGEPPQRLQQTSWGLDAETAYMTASVAVCEEHSVLTTETIQIAVSERLTEVFKEIQKQGLDVTK